MAAAASSSSSPSEPSAVQTRNWTELPEDVTASILSRLGAIAILTSAQMVCKTWHSVCKSPLMWRKLAMRDYAEEVRYDCDRMCRHAVDRSCGDLVDLTIEDFGSDGLLEYITDRSRRIKRLRLVRCFGITNEGLNAVASKLPLLEDLEISICEIEHEPLQVIGASCPLLKSLNLNHQWHSWSYAESNDDALAIAGSMHGLHHLQLFANRLTNDGLQAILDHCPHLESLDLRLCFNLDLGGTMGRTCTERIKKLRLPKDPTDDYEFDATYSDYGSWSDGDPMAGYYDRDLMIDYDDEIDGFSYGYDNSFDDYDLEDDDHYPWIY